MKPKSTVSFAIGSNAFTASGRLIGIDSARIEAELGFTSMKNAKLGISYQG